MTLFGNGDREYPAFVCRVEAGSKIGAVKIPSFWSLIGTVLVRITPVLNRVPCQSAKKKVLFFWMGPPATKPYWFRRNRGLGTVVAKRFRAFNFSLRKNSNNVPCRSFDPDF